MTRRIGLISACLMLVSINLSSVDCFCTSNKLRLQFTGFANETCYPVGYYELGKQRHECDRVCQKNQPRQCHYVFSLETFETYNAVACSAKCDLTKNCHKCVQTDGVQTPIIVVNWQAPAPNVVACEGDTIILDVINHMKNYTTALEENVAQNLDIHLRQFGVTGDTEMVESLAKVHKDLRKFHSPITEGMPTSIHWHGLFQKGTLEHDGVPFITQNLIPFGQYYRYKFKADQSGSFFYHSHFDYQSGDGLAGAFTLRTVNDPQASLYDYDLSEHTLLMTDFGHNLSHRADTILLNGFGRFQGGGVNSAFEVRPGSRYRFRIIYNGLSFTPLVLSVEKHRLQVIAVDGFPVQRKTVDSLVFVNAERVDFVLETNAPVGNYLIHVRGERNASLFQNAVLHYTGAPLPDLEQDAAPTATQSSNGTLQLNTSNVGPGTIGSVVMAELFHISPAHKCIRSTDVDQIFLHFRVSQRGFQINNITMKLPVEALYAQLYNTGFVNETGFCNEMSLAGRNCVDEICSCTHVIKLKMKRTIEIVLFGGHPFHLHGFAFNVVAMGVAPTGQQMNKELFQAMDKQGLVKRNLYNPPAKDVVTVPASGYTVLRFCTDNPGLWFAHCHIKPHLLAGMAVVFMVGTKKEILASKDPAHNPNPFKNNICRGYPGPNDQSHERTCKYRRGGMLSRRLIG